VDVSDPIRGLGGSAYLQKIHGLKTGTPPRIDLQKEKRLHDAVRSMITAGLVKSAHDCSEGGFAVALAESCISHQIARETPKLLGATVDLSEINADRLDAMLFGEAQSRIIVSVSGANLNRTLELAREMGVSANRIGEVGGAKLGIQIAQQTFEWNLTDLYDGWWNSIARAMQV